MADAVIAASAVQNAPAGYTVPGAQEILVKSVRAIVDGSGAGAAFDAVLQLIDPAGNVVWQSPTDTTIAAGGSADVSWFPRVGGGAGSSAVVNNAQTAYVWGVNTGSQTVASGLGGANVAWRHFQTTDSSIFGTDTLANAVPPYQNAAGDNHLYFNKSGAYLVAGSVIWAAGAYNQGGLVNNTGSQFALSQTNNVDAIDEEMATNTAPVGINGRFGPYSYRMYYVDATATPGVVTFFVAQTSGVNKTISDFNMGAFYLGGTTALLAQLY